MKRLLLLLAALSLTACASLEGQIRDDREAYLADTRLAERLVQPVGLEPMHGEVTLVVGQRLAQALLAASLQPSVVKVEVATPGRVWRSEQRLFGLKTEQGAWLDSGQLDLLLATSELALENDVLAARLLLTGSGELAARLHLLGLDVARPVALALHADAPVQLQLIALEDGWGLQPQGTPVPLTVQVTLPTLTVMGHALPPMEVKRELGIDPARLQPLRLPMPAPRLLDVAGEPVAVSLTRPVFGARRGLLWLGAEVSAAK